LGLIWLYDTKYAPRFLAVDLGQIIVKYTEEVQQGRMSIDQVKEKAQQISRLLEEEVKKHPRTVILDKRAVIGGSVLEKTF